MSRNHYLWSWYGCIACLQYTTWIHSFQNTSQEVLLHIEEQNKLEKMNALDLIEINSKKEKLQIMRRYTSHYLLGLKVC